MNSKGQHALALLWIFTGLTSLYFNPDIGYDIIRAAEFNHNTATLLIYSGSILDIVIGLWVFSSWNVKLCGLAQIAIIISYSILLTLFDPSFWLHPFGPLTKNLPILVLILIYMKLYDDIQKNA